MNSSPIAQVRLEAGREKSLLRRHPWVFASAVADDGVRLRSGATVDLVSSEGRFLARAAWSPESAIRARVWTFDADEAVDADFFRRRVMAAAGARAAQKEAFIEGGGGDEALAAMRLVHGESDGLPGLLVDRYGEVAVCQFLSAGVERWQEEIVDVLAALPGIRTVWERSDTDARHKEGLPVRRGLRRGAEPAALVEIDEDGRRYFIDVREGHKTGFYLDQRGGRRAARRWCRGRDVLNAFSYTGGFSVAALAGGAAHVLDVDTSAAALDLARRNVAANGLGGDRYESLEGDVFSVLRRLRDSRRSFDAIVLDPPKFADSRAHLDKAARGYKDINLLAMKLLRPGGVLLTFSCSGLVGADLFQKIVADAAVDARRDAVVVERLFQGPDHPVSLAFPEGAYLKGLVCRVA